MTSFKNTLKHQRIRPNKLRRLANLIRHKELGFALQILRNIPHKGSEHIYKMLKSTYSNAIQSGVSNNDSFFVEDIQINEGPRMKRYKARARGRMFGIIKRTSHISLSISTKGVD